MTKKKIFIIGEINVDLIMTGENVEPQWNQEKLVDSFDLVLGSSSCITAAGLAGLGMDVYFVGLVGDDVFGHFCVEELKKKGINTSYVKLVPHIQTGVTLSLSTSKDRALLTYMGTISELGPNDIPEEIYDLADHIHFGSYFLQTNMKQHWKDVLIKARSKNVTTSFDTGWDPNEKWDRDVILSLMEDVNLFIPSEVEINNIFELNDVSQVKEILPEKYENVIVKLGAKGSMMINAQGNTTRVSGYSIKPIDTTGAGDSFNAGLIYGYLHGLKNSELLEFANACGALATLRIGGASSVPSVADVIAFQTENKIVN
ncbi:carbohydrate kinase family protein [Lederbergia wuyishanensis]|uniref:Sugar/nucleoside kinase (Ribokinase family) n=1 Tax=Lederbergia wuyishanensis TaxID=1347903 RepID=A0ABU0D3R1_9BACI|nr:carbohydrate kinase family protein [Lederbergia wuyishanensis]MCJ8007798.1 carbohydrate kinase family protein [Lederbergia wuyishanensis]MDQ0343037.1 sugar/nucleoside kinase (ribokinase family) [Lederbergia wuyishanensis]